MADVDAAPVTTNGVSTAPHENSVPEAVGVKVFAGNLAYSVTDDELKTFFNVVENDILSAQVILRGTRSAGYGFVALASQEAADSACAALNGKDLSGRPVIVEVAKQPEQKEKDRSEKKPKRRVGRRGSKPVPGEVSEAEANGEAEKPHVEGEAAESKLKKKKKNTKKPKRKTNDAAAAGENGVETEHAATEKTEAPEARKKAPKPKRAPRPPRAIGEEPAGEPSTTTLFVANLAFSVDDAGLEAIFTEAGFKVNSARVVRRRWGHPRKSKGFGFVDVGNAKEQERAIQVLQGKELEGGRPIAIKIAVNPVEEKEGAEEEKDAEAPVVA